MAAAAIKGKVKVTGIGRNSIQGDRLFADVLAQMGAKVTWGEDFIQVEKSELKGIDMDMNHIPDAAMTIAITALFAQGETVIRNIYNWRVKETDRLTAIATELRKVGAEVEEGKILSVFSLLHWINLNMLKLLLITTIGLRCVFRSLHYQIHR